MLDIKYKEAMEIFLEEVEITYGIGISDSCRKRIEKVDDIEALDLREILEDSKKEWGFTPENSTMEWAKLHFNS